MVLPHLEYCCPLWSPTVIGKIRDLEAVQRSFTVKMKGLANLDYWARTTWTTGPDYWDQLSVGGKVISSSTHTRLLEVWFLT